MHDTPQAGLCSTRVGKTNGLGGAMGEASPAAIADLAIERRRPMAVAGNPTDRMHAAVFDTLPAHHTLITETVADDARLEPPRFPTHPAITAGQRTARAGIHTLAAEVAGALREVDDRKTVGILLQQPARTLVAATAAAAAQRQEHRLGH